MFKLKWDYYTNEQLWYYSYEEPSPELRTAFYSLANQKIKGKLPNKYKYKYWTGNYRKKFQVQTKLFFPI